MPTPSAYQQMKKTRGDIAFKSALHKALRKYSRRVKGVKVGIFPESVYPDGTPVAQAAFFAEYGTVTEPPRPFMSQTAQWERDEVGKVLREKLVASGSLTGAFKDTGEVLANRMKVMLASGDFDPLSPVTLILRKWVDEGRIDREDIGAGMVAAARRAAAAGEQGATGERARPLLDTLQMYDSIKSKVML